jgi:copper chaperone CopZ
MRTEFIIEGADCGRCLNETLEHLQAVEGVRSAHASSADGCLVIEHDGVSVEELVRRLHDQLHGTELSGNEVVMTEVNPTVRVLGCPH